MNKGIMRVKLFRALLSCSLLLPYLYACSAQVAPSLMTTPSREDESPSQEYMIGPEGTVEVQVWKNPDLSKTVTVRPDGRMSLTIVRDAQAAGQTATQLTEAVTEALKTYYKEPAQVTLLAM